LRPAFEIVYFGGAVAALAVVDQPVLARIFGGLALFHLVALYAGERPA
jgi:hypothetical protein